MKWEINGATVYCRNANPTFVDIPKLQTVLEKFVNTVNRGRKEKFTSFTACIHNFSLYVCCENSETREDWNIFAKHPKDFYAVESGNSTGNSTKWTIDFDAPRCIKL